jgi:hypothetical protein
MIDRTARDTAALLIRRFAAGRLTNDEFDEAFPRSRLDQALSAIEGRAWHLYDDFETHRLTGRHGLTRAGRREIARWVLFLHSEVEYEWPWFNWYRGARRRGSGRALLNLLMMGWLEARMAREEAGMAAFQRTGDFAVWPFFRPPDFEAARRQPRFCVGRVA